MMKAVMTRQRTDKGKMWRPGLIGQPVSGPKVRFSQALNQSIFAHVSAHWPLADIDEIDGWACIGTGENS